MKIVYEQDGILIAETFVHNVEVNFPHVVIDREISEPIETWYIENGKIKIHHEKLIEYNRTQLPTLTKREFRKKLRDAKIFDQAEAYVRASGDGYLEDAWDYADFFARLDPFIIQASEALGLTPEQVDSIWVS